MARPARRAPPENARKWGPGAFNAMKSLTPYESTKLAERYLALLAQAKRAADLEAENERLREALEMLAAADDPERLATSEQVRSFSGYVLKGWRA